MRWWRSRRHRSAVKRAELIRQAKEVLRRRRGNGHQGKPGKVVKP
jgi:hypothetical protein